MKTAYLVILGLSWALGAKASDDSTLLEHLSEAKFTLIDAIKLAEKQSGPATSAKFEMDGDQLVFSVYTAPQGLKTLPEETELTEILGGATVWPTTPKAEVFSDKAHIARASSHLTLMQLSCLTLREVVQTALSKKPGIAYSVKNPVARNHRAYADVSILRANGKTVVVPVDMLSGCDSDQEE